METSLADEQRKLQELKSNARNEDFDNRIERLMEEYRVMDETILTAQKQLDSLLSKRKHLRSDLDTMAMRDETLQKDKNSASMKMKELRITIDERIEGAIIDKTIEF